MKRFFLIVVFGCFLALPEGLVAQSNQVQLGARFDRLQKTLLVAHRESGIAGSILELVPEQSEKLQKLREEYIVLSNEVGEMIKEAAPGPGPNNLKAFFVMMERMMNLEKKLNDEILLAHQVAVLKDQVFLAVVKEYDGNIVEAITRTYSDEFGLDSNQVKRLCELKDDVNKRVAEAKAKFKKEMEDIAKSADKDMRAIFSKEQVEKFEEYPTTKSK